MNKLIFNNKEYELVEIGNSTFRLYSEKDLSDIGWNNLPWHISESKFTYEMFSIKIKDKFYGLKPIT